MDFAPKGSTPDTTIPVFSVQPVQNNFKSSQEGHPVFEDKEFVQIITPGLSKSVASEEVTDEHKQRWPQRYAAFKAGQEPPTEGTPLAEWPSISQSLALTLKAQHVRTVEDLASLHDNLLGALGTGGRELRSRAKAWLESAHSSAPLERALDRAFKAEHRVTELEAQVRDLSDRLTTYKERADARAEV